MPETDERTLSERVFEASLQVNRIVHLGPQVAWCDENAVDGELLEDYLTDEATLGVLCEASRPLPDTGLQPTPQDVWNTMEELGQYGTDGKVEAFREFLVGAGLDSGWLIEGQHPQYEPSPLGRGCSGRCGWGLLRSFYGATYEQALDKAIAWAETDLDTAMNAGQPVEAENS